MTGQQVNDARQRCAYAVMRATQLVWNREWARDAAKDVTALGRARYRRGRVVLLLGDRGSDE